MNKKGGKNQENQEHLICGSKMTKLKQSLKRNCTAWILLLQRQQPVMTSGPWGKAVTASHNALLGFRAKGAALRFIPTISRPTPLFFLTTWPLSPSVCGHNRMGVFENMDNVEAGDRGRRSCTRFVGSLRVIREDDVAFGMLDKIWQQN